MGENPIELGCKGRKGNIFQTTGQMVYSGQFKHTF